MSRKYRKGPCIDKDRDQNCSKVKPKLFEYLRKIGTSNGSQSPKLQYSRSDTRSNYNRTISEILSKNDCSNARFHANLRRSLSPKLCLPATDEKYSTNRTQSEVLERMYCPKANPKAYSSANSLSNDSKYRILRASRPDAISRENRLSNQSKSPKSKSSRTDAIVSHDHTQSLKSNSSQFKGRQPHNRMQSEEAKRHKNLEDKSQESPRASGYSNLLRTPIPPFSQTGERPGHSHTQSFGSERSNQSKVQSQLSTTTGDISNHLKTETANDDIVMHLRPSLFCCTSKDLRCQEKVYKNDILHEASGPSSSVLIGQEQMRDCKEYCTCSTYMLQDLQQKKQMQLQQALQQANYEYDRRQQQQFQDCERAHYGYKRREEAERICCSGYSHQQLQHRQQQKERRQELQQHIQQQQRQIEQQQHLQQQQQQQIQQEQIQQHQQGQQQHKEQKHHMQQQQYVQQKQHQQQQLQQQQRQQQQMQQRNDYILINHCAQNQQQEEKSCYCRYLQNHQQQKIQKEDEYTYYCRCTENYQLQPQQHVQLADTQTSPSFSQQHMQQQQYEENCYANYSQHLQQQEQSEMMKLQENNLQNEALLNCNNCLVALPKQQLQCNCNVTPEPDLSNIRSSFYQQTLHKYGIHCLPEDYLQKMPAEAICCVPCSCCTCCPCAYDHQQQQHQQQPSQ